jgi:hypothetical protein
MLCLFRIKCKPPAIRQTYAIYQHIQMFSFALRRVVQRPALLGGCVRLSPSRRRRISGQGLTYGLYTCFRNDSASQPSPRKRRPINRTLIVTSLFYLLFCRAIKI